MLKHIKKVKVANLVFNPFVNDSRVIKETLSLTNAGYEVEVIAHLNENLLEYEEKDGYIIRRFSYLNRKIMKSKLVKLKAYLTYCKQAIFYCKGFDILHCNDLNTLPIGFVIKKFYNKDIKIVYDAHEYETEIDGLQGLQQNFTKILEKFFIKYVDKMITVSEAISNEYAKIYSIEKPYLVLNTPPYKKIEKKDIFRESLEIEKNKTIFLYQGGLSSGRGIEILLDAFKNIDDDKSVIVFMGYGELESLIKINSEKYSNIYFHQAVAPDVLLDYTSSADFGILFYENSCLNHDYCSPNKMFEYLMAELPVVVSNLYEMKRLVENKKIGVVAKENTSNGLTIAIKEAIRLDSKKLKENIQKVKNIYNWENQEKVLLDLYKGLK